jgi:hypothetical protein
MARRAPLPLIRCSITTRWLPEPGSVRASSPPRNAHGVGFVMHSHSRVFACSLHRHEAPGAEPMHTVPSAYSGQRSPAFTALVGHGVTTAPPLPAAPLVPAAPPAPAAPPDAVPAAPPDAVPAAPPAAAPAVPAAPPVAAAPALPPPEVCGDGSSSEPQATVAKQAMATMEA